MNDKKVQSGYQPTKAEMEEVIAVEGTSDEIAAAVLRRLLGNIFKESRKNRYDSKGNRIQGDADDA